MYINEMLALIPCMQPQRAPRVPHKRETWQYTGVQILAKQSKVPPSARVFDCRSTNTLVRPLNACSLAAKDPDVSARQPYQGRHFYASLAVCLLVVYIPAYTQPSVYSQIWESASNTSTSNDMAAQVRGSFDLLQAPSLCLTYQSPIRQGTGKACLSDSE